MLSLLAFPRVGDNQGGDRQAQCRGGGSLLAFPARQQRDGSRRRIGITFPAGAVGTAAPALGLP